MENAKVTGITASRKPEDPGGKPGSFGMPAGARGRGKGGDAGKSTDNRAGLCYTLNSANARRKKQGERKYE